MKKTHILTMATMALWLLTSCSHKEFYVGGTADLTVEFDWKGTTNADPASMMLVTFASGAQPVEKPLQGHQGGTMLLPQGEYQLIAFNSDTEVLHSQGDTWSNYEVYAEPTQLRFVSRMFASSMTIPRGAGTADQQEIAEPDPLWTSATEAVTITGYVGKHVVMPMEEATFMVNFHIKNVDNMEFVSDVLATVSGMAGSWRPAQHTCSDTQCIIPFSLTRSGNSMSGSVRTFGYRATKANGEEQKHLLVIYAELTDGSKKYYTFDVSNQMNAVVPKGGGTITAEVNIELEDLPLPKPMSTGSGLEPDVENWEEVLIPVDM